MCDDDTAVETTDSEWEAKCEQMADEMEADNRKVDAGEMTVEEFDAKY